MHTIEICGCMVVNVANELLMVRKRNSVYYQLPGGKIEVGESHLEALQRELFEEIGLVVMPGGLEYLGVHETTAVNEGGTRVRGYIFKALLGAGDLHGLAPMAELEEMVWVNVLNYQQYRFAHLAREFVVPIWLSGFQE